MTKRPAKPETLVTCWQKNCLRPTSFWMTWALILSGGCQAWSCVITNQDY